MRLSAVQWAVLFVASLTVGCIVAAMTAAILRRAALRVFPELSLFGPDRRARSAAFRQAGRNGPTVCGFVLLVPALCWIFLGPRAIVHAWPRLPRAAADAIVWGPTVLALIVVPPVITRTTIRRRLRRELVRRGIRVCLECGSDLRGVPAVACTHCGASPNAEPTGEMPGPRPE